MSKLGGRSDSGRAELLGTDCLLVFHHLSSNFSLTPALFPQDKSNFDVLVRDKFFGGKSIAFSILTPSEQIVNFDDLRQLVDDLRADSNDQRGATPFVVVRLEKQKDGTMQINQDDFENTSLPMTQDSRVPKANIETRQVYQPEIAFEEFLDNSLQYVQHSEVKIISTTIDLKQNLISFLDTGEGISFDDIRQWATPADAYVVAVPVRWNRFSSKDKKKLSFDPVFTIARDSPEKFTTIESPEHNAQLGILNWWGLGGKLAAANLGGDGCSLILKTRHKKGKPGIAIVKPGIWKYQVGQLQEQDFPTDPILKRKDIVSFAEFTIKDADVDRLTESIPLKTYAEKLRTEFANVYYVYLVGPDVFASRIEQLNRVSVSEAILAVEPPQWELAEEKGPKLLLNGKEVDHKSCFFHRCLSNARCAFSFRIEFATAREGDAKKSTEQAPTSYEVNTTILYFATSDDVPNYDDRITAGDTTRSSFALWNGKLMFNQSVDFFKEWGLRGIPPGIERRVRVFIHFSRTFKPKQNKEGIDDHAALQRYREICSDGHQRGIRQKIEGFLTECHSNDCKSELIWDKTTTSVIGVKVGANSTIMFGNYYDLHVPAPKQRRVLTYYDCLVLSADVDERGSQVILKMLSARLDGTKADKGLVCVPLEINAKEISSAVPSKPHETAKKTAYAQVTPDRYYIKFFDHSRNAELTNTELRSGDRGIVAVVTLGSESVDNIFTLKPLPSVADRINHYVQPLKDSKKLPDLTITELDKTMGSLQLKWNDKEKNWSGPADFLTHSGKTVWDLTIKASISGDAESVPLVFRNSKLNFKLAISHGAPAIVRVLEYPTVTTIGEIYPLKLNLLDAQNMVIPNPDISHLRASIAGTDLRVDINGRWDSLAFCVSGSIPPGREKSKLCISFALISQEVPIQLVPGLLHSLQLPNPPDLGALLNHSIFEAEVVGRDLHGNAVALKDELAVDGDLTESPLLLGDKLSFEMSSWLLLPDLEPGLNPRTALVYPTLTVGKADPRVPAFVDEAIAPQNVFVAYYDFLRFTRGEERALTGRLRCFPGDTVWFFASARMHLVRIFGFKKDGTKIKVLGAYFYAHECDGEAVSNLKDMEAVISTQLFVGDAEDLKVWAKSWILSERAYKKIATKGTNFGEVRFCNRALIVPFSNNFVSLVATKPSTGEFSVPVMIGHTMGLSLKINMNADAEKPLLLHPSFQEILRRERIELYNPSRTVVASYGVCYNGMAIDASTKIGALGLNSNCPLVIGIQRHALDQYNQTLRIASVMGQPKSKQVSIWSDVRVFVSPSSLPYSINIDCKQVDPDPRETWIWDPDHTSLKSVCELRAPSSSWAEFTVTILSEAGGKCDVTGQATVGNRKLPIVGGAGIFKVRLPNEKSKIEFYYQNLYRSVAFDPEPAAPQAISVVTRLARVGEPMKFQVTFGLADGTPTRLPLHVSQSLTAVLHGPANIFAQAIDSSQVDSFISTCTTGYIAIQTSGILATKSGTSHNFKLVVNDRGKELSCDFPVVVELGAAERLVFRPKNGFNVKSGERLPEAISLFGEDAGGNKTELTQPTYFGAILCKLGGLPLSVRPKDGKVMIPANTFTALQQGNGSIQVRCGDLNCSIPVQIGPGHAPASLSAVLSHTASGQFGKLINIRAGVSTKHVSLICDVKDENGDIMDGQHLAVQVKVPGGKVITVPYGSSLLGDLPVFTQAGVYRVEVIFKSDIFPEGFIEPERLQITVVKDSPLWWHVGQGSQSEVITELDTSFAISGRITDQFGNLCDTNISLIYNSDLIDLEFVHPTDDTQTLAQVSVNGDFVAKVVATLKEGNILPSDQLITLNLGAGDPISKLLGELPIRVKARAAPTEPTRKRTRGAGQEKSVPKVATRAQQVASANQNEAFRAALQQIKAFIETDSMSQVNYPKSNASFYVDKTIRPQLGCPAFELVFLKFPEQWNIILEGRPIKFWEDIRLAMSRYTSFLNTVLIYANVFEEYRNHVNVFMNGPLKGRKIKFNFAQICDDRPDLLAVQRPRNEREKDLVDFLSLLRPSEKLPLPVRAGIVAWLRNKCPRWKVCLTKEACRMYEGQIEDTFFCLETGTIHRPASQNAEIEGNMQDHQGPVVRYLADTAYINSLKSRIHDWKDVFLASWRKYPSPKRPDILSVDIVNKEFDPASGVLTTTRLIIAEGYVPVWLRPLFGGGVVMFVEETRVDPKNQRMKLFTRNVSYDNILKTEEICEYTPDPMNRLWTQLKQSCRVSMIGGMMASSAEEYMVKKFSTNAQKGRDIMESAILLCEQERLATQ